MKVGQFTGVTDVDKLVEMVLDENLDTDTRGMAVVDLSFDYDFNWHRLLDFAADPAQPSSIRSIIFDQQNWDERSIPIILGALQEDNDEIQFWASFALISLRWYWQKSDFDRIIFALDNVIQNDNVAPSMWHVGREAFYPLELANYSKITAEKLDFIRLHIISPRLEYFDFEIAQQKTQTIDEPTLKIEPQWLQEKISRRFKSAKFNIRRPEVHSYLLDWRIGYGKFPLYGALHRDGFCIVLMGVKTSIRRFAEWYRTIISKEHVLRLYEWVEKGELL